MIEKEAKVRKGNTAHSWGVGSLKYFPAFEEDVTAGDKNERTE
jgi:hypothetical protein